MIPIMILKMIPDKSLRMSQNTVKTFGKFPGKKIAVFGSILRVRVVSRLNKGYKMTEFDYLCDKTPKWV